MEIQSLNEFVALAEIGNYLEAADELHLSQSALSKHIQKLEEELGVKLFDRNTRSIELTKYGDALLSYARSIIETTESALRHIQKLRVQDDRTLVIAYPPALQRFGLIELFSEFRRNHPEITLEEVFTVDPAEALHSRRCDAAFAQYGTISGTNVRSELYKRDNLVAVLPKDHPLAGQTTISLQDLREEYFLHRKLEWESTILQQTTLKQLCAKAGFEPKIRLSASFSSTIVSLISQGLGIAVMQRLQVQGDLSKVVMVELEPAISADIHLYWVEEGRYSESQNALIRAVQESKHDSI